MIHTLCIYFSLCFSLCRVLDQLRSLVAMNESLKRQESQFKAHCREEKTRLEAEIERLQTSAGQGTSQDQERLANIMRHFESDKERMQKIRALLVSHSTFTFSKFYFS